MTDTLSDKLGTQWRDGLESIVSSQLEQYGALDALSERQRACIESGDTDRLMGLLGERTEIIESIAASAERLLPYSEAWSEIEATAPRGGGSATCSAGSTRSRRWRSRSRAGTPRTRRHDRAAQDSIADKLSGVNKSKKAAQAYAGPRQSGARYQDREA